VCLYLTITLTKLVVPVVKASKNTRSPLFQPSPNRNLKLPVYFLSSVKPSSGTSKKTRPRSSKSTVSATSLFGGIE